MTECLREDYSSVCLLRKFRMMDWILNDLYVAHELVDARISIFNV